MREQSIVETVFKFEFTKTAIYFDCWVYQTSLNSLRHTSRKLHLRMLSVIKLRFQVNLRTVFSSLKLDLCLRSWNNSPVTIFFLFILALILSVILQ